MLNTLEITQFKQQQQQKTFKTLLKKKKQTKFQTMYVFFRSLAGKMSGRLQISGAAVH